MARDQLATHPEAAVHRDLLPLPQPAGRLQRQVIVDFDLVPAEMLLKHALTTRNPPRSPHRTTVVDSFARQGCSARTRHIGRGSTSAVVDAA